MMLCPFFVIALWYFTSTKPEDKSYLLTDRYYYQEVKDLDYLPKMPGGFRSLEILMKEDCYTKTIFNSKLMAEAEEFVDCPYITYWGNYGKNVYRITYRDGSYKHYTISDMANESEWEETEYVK